MGKNHQIRLLLALSVLSVNITAIEDGFYGGPTFLLGTEKASITDLNIDMDLAANPTGAPEIHKNKYSTKHFSPGLSLSYLISTEKVTVAPELYIALDRTKKSKRFLSHQGSAIHLNLKEESQLQAGANLKVGHVFYEPDVFVYGLLGVGVNVKKLSASLNSDMPFMGQRVRKKLNQVSVNLGVGIDYFVTPGSVLTARVEYHMRPASHTLVSLINDGFVDHTSRVTYKTKSSIGLHIGYGIKF